MFCIFILILLLLLLLQYAVYDRQLLTFSFSFFVQSAAISTEIDATYKKRSYPNKKALLKKTYFFYYFPPFQQFPFQKMIRLKQIVKQGKFFTLKIQLLGELKEKIWYIQLLKQKSNILIFYCIQMCWCYNIFKGNDFIQMLVALIFCLVPVWMNENLYTLDSLSIVLLIYISFTQLPVNKFYMQLLL
eukprot:TRINITY_DN10440_c2_g1_i1.p2 TRINITY_DN10440_c2_g1~~TRINITY_DN10440_c2_g1_i1.p2  ORF type:complete len:188 (-),score=-14.74 TRINITY_DN10440_c2_g1_i1:28-591(-)